MKKILVVSLIVLTFIVGGIFFAKSLTPQETAPAVATSTPPVTELARDNMETWNWVYSEMSPQGTQFMYPDPLPTSYVIPVAWPPTVVVTGGKLECTQGMVPDASGERKLFARRTIGGQEYCVGFGAEGAAGSTYTSYEYNAQQGDFIVRMSFTLRTPQCLNYEGSRAECMSGRAGALQY